MIVSLCNGSLGVMLVQDVVISSSCHDRQATRSAIVLVHKVLGAVFVHDGEVNIFVFHLCDVITS